MAESPYTSKPSHYNCFVNLPESGVLLAYNGITTAAAEFPIETKEIIGRILESPNSEYSDKELDIKQTLLQGGFLIPVEVDENTYLKVRNRKARFNSSQVSYTILVTKDCNLCCPYCYQKHNYGTILPEVRDAIIEMAARETRGGKPLFVTWFGGEPLLYVDILFELSKRLKKVALKNKSVLKTSIITNGYLLNLRIAKRLVKMGCTDAQVTLDGPKRIHDKKRILHGGGPTFEHIVRNVRESSSILPIVIRVNIDINNAEYVDELLDELSASGLRRKVGLYFQRIQPYTEVCADVAGICFGAEDFSKYEAKFTMKMIEKGFGASRYPNLKSGFCIADSLGGKTICPDGTIVKCWNDVSHQHEAVGHLIQPTLSEGKTIQNSFKWLNWDPFEKSDCLQCPVLPNCMGGCPYEALRAKHPNRGACSTLKFNLKETIALTYLHKRTIEEMERRRGNMGSGK
ncbi:MAG: radical SAM protein [Candidatus Aminicenantes bacterium]|nr:MAG: radical SAM protein [Candidatus Aminicenantes bacterium]